MLILCQAAHTQMEISKDIWVSVAIHPNQMDQLQKNIMKNLLTQILGQCVEDVGYIKDVTNIMTVKDKLVSDKTGNGHFDVHCSIITIQPERGDIIEATITSLIHDKGVYAEAGPICIFAKWSPKMKTVYEHHTCSFKMLHCRYEEDAIQCIGELV